MPDATNPNGWPFPDRPGVPLEPEMCANLDIVQRLRRGSHMPDMQPMFAAMCEAAGKIEKLRAAEAERDELLNAVDAAIGEIERGKSLSALSFLMNARAAIEAARKERGDG
jgi:predicted Zn-dependent protease